MLRPVSVQASWEGIELVSGLDSVPVRPLRSGLRILALRWGNQDVRQINGGTAMLFEDQLGNFLFIVVWSAIVLVAVYWVVRRAIRDESTRK